MSVPGNLAAAVEAAAVAVAAAAAAAAWKPALAGGFGPQGAVPCTSTSTAVSAPSATR